MNEAHNRGIEDLVADYESMSDRGAVTFVDERAYERLIDYFEQEEQIDRALEVAGHALSQFRYSVDFYLKQAHLFIIDNRAEQALASLEEATTYSPLEPGIQLMRAEAFISLGRVSEAAILLEDLKPGAGRELLSDIYFVEAMLYEQQEMYERMYYCLVSALRENPYHRDALEHIWMAIEQGKRHEESVDLFEQILEVDAYSSLGWHNLGHAHAYLGRYAEAIECYEYAYLSDEHFEQAYRDCADLCFEVRQFNKALACYEELLERFDNEADVLLRIGQCHLQLGHIRIARTFFTQALQLDSSDDEILFHLGLCYAHESAWPQAIRYFTKAISIEDTREEYFGALADAYFRHGKLEKAETNFELAIDAAPEESRYWLQYMCFLLDTNRGEEALDVIEEANECAAGGELLYGRVVCLAAIGRRQEALYWLGEALEEDYDTHRTLFELMPDLERDPDVISLIAARML